MRETAVKYEWTEDMGEISQFGGAYEECCRDMLFAALEWFDEHPGAERLFTGSADPFRVMHGENEEARSLSEAIRKAAKARGGATEAMFRFTLHVALVVQEDGWEAFQEAMRHRASGDLA